ncbi:MAG: bifunctional oligoribonuclease/PAP phosphatase NrnA [Candidatus Omnitrophica bacterium]|nr:bifunctional oligoribonuclease/PAP phosphatase NrnA [Candidatus Omnitrophota bacterium]
MNKVIEALKKNKRFLISAHVNLEGDSIGSQLAMKELLLGLGKEALILDDDVVPEHYRFLPKASEISNDLGTKFEFDAAIVLDCPTLKRTGKVADIITARNKPVINIDHHISNESFGDVNWVDPNASSAGEMVFKLFKGTAATLTKEGALWLYIAILTDTGSFNYDNTSSITHEIAGELLGYGLEPAAVSETVYERRSLSDIKLLGLALSTITMTPSGDIAHIEITKDMLRKTGADIAKSEGVINYPRSIENVKIAIFFKDDLKNQGMINISFRSKGDVDVNKIASAFGGGGHAKAAGCCVKGNLAEVKRKVLAKAEEALRKGKI